jgi:hypothetical protein
VRKSGLKDERATVGSVILAPDFLLLAQQGLLAFFVSEMDNGTLGTILQDEEGGLT